MSKEDAFSDARDIMDEYVTYVNFYPYSSEIAMRTSLTRDEAEATIMSDVQKVLGDLLYKFGDYGKEHNNGKAKKREDV